LGGLADSSDLRAQPIGAISRPVAEAEEDPFDPVGVGVADYAELSALLEVTIFQIDVLTLTVRVGADDAELIGALVEGREYSAELADSVAAVILETRDAWAHQVFHRNVGMGRFLGGIRETAEKAAEAGFITREYFEEFSANLPIWFSFLEETGSKKGDEIVFRIRGDRLRTVYRTVDGRILLDQEAEGAEARRASIPSFYAPGTRFRERLVKSLLPAES
jgi:hypothetical protein